MFGIPPQYPKEALQLRDGTSVVRLCQVEVVK